MRVRIYSDIARFCDVFVIGEMAEVFKRFSYILLTRTADIVNTALGDKTPDIPLELFNNLIDFKKWLQEESEDKI